jgi:hypothetical protein
MTACSICAYSGHRAQRVRLIARSQSGIARS